MNSFVILGIHDFKVDTVRNNVARVRMYVNNQEIDQDFALPILPETIDLSLELCRDLLTNSINQRMGELEAAPVSQEKSFEVFEVVTSDVTIATQPVMQPVVETPIAEEVPIV